MDMEKETQEQPSSHGLLAKALSLSPDRQAIVENDGIFSIRSDLPTGGMVLDPNLKALVDSVLDGGNPAQP